MFKKVNSNKNGVIEYAIDDVEDLNKLPRKETDNTVYAILNKDGKRLVYLYSKAEKDYILINGGGDLEEINREINSINEQLEDIANKGTTVEVIERITKEEIDRQIADGTIASIIPTLKVRDLVKGEIVVNLSSITGDKYLEALFDFTKLTAEDVKISDEKDANKFFTLTKVEPSEGGACVLGYNGQMVNNPQAYSIGLVFRGDGNNGTGIFKFEGGDKTAVNYKNLYLSLTNTAYYGDFKAPLDIDTFMFLLIGLDMPNDTMNVWVNGIKKASYSLGGRKIGNVGYLNQGYWGEGGFIFNKVALFKKANFTDRELKAITDYIFTTNRYLYVDTSKSFLSIKNGLVRHLTMKNNSDGVIKDIVYKDIIRNTTSVTSEGFVLSERIQLTPGYSLEVDGGGIFIRFDKSSDTDNKFIFNYSDTEYLWVNFSTNEICSQRGINWIIRDCTVQFSEKNVIYFDSSKKVYLNGKHIYDVSSRYEYLELLIKDLKNEYPIKDYVCYARSLNDDEIMTISTELCSY